MKLSDIRPMLAKRSPAFSRRGWLYEFKFHGWRGIADSKQILTRSGQDVTARFKPIAEALNTLPAGSVFDGEICMVDERGIPDFTALLSTRPRRDRVLVYFVFDLLFERDNDLRSLPLTERKARLRELLSPVHPRLRYVDHIETDGELLYAYALTIGLEGVVAKKADSPYVAGTNNYWFKFKPRDARGGFRRSLRRRSTK